MATLYAKTGIGNFDDAAGWNSAADGSGTDYTASDSGGGAYIVDDAGNTLDLNGKAVTLNVSVTAALIQAASGTLTVSGTRTINGNVTYSGTSTGGMVIVGTDAALTINGQVTNTSSGIAVLTSDNGVLSISNAGGTCISNSGSNRAVYHYATGNLTITGTTAVHQTGGNGALTIGGSCTFAITGNLFANSGTAAVWVANGSGTITGDILAEHSSATTAGSLYISGSGVALTWAGMAETSADGVALSMNAGTVTWTGSRTLAGNKSCLCRLHAGTLNLATAGAKLALSNSGSFALIVAGGTLNTADVGAGAAEIVNQADTAQAVILGGTEANRAIVQNYPTPAQIAAAMWNDTTSPDRTLTS